MFRHNDQKVNLVNLFSGCGGFALGARQAGFRVIAAVDNDPTLSSSYPYNFPNTRMILADLTQLDGKSIKEKAAGRVDGVFGGPPCQGFSSIGKRYPNDPRRSTLGHFFRIVQEIEPIFFAMENVRGLAYSDARYVLEEALQLVENEYSIMEPSFLNAAHFGAATNRVRLFVIGIRKDCGEAVSLEDFDTCKRTPATVRSAIKDLEGAVSLGDCEGFDTWRIDCVGRPSDYARALRTPGGLFTGHRPTEHSVRVIARFKKVLQGGIDPVGRHQRLSWLGQCPTLRAGTGADRGSYQSVRPIHPEQPRVITVREAARLQGFPDRHRFHSTVWHSFRMIGNSVSPIIARAIFRVIGTKLRIGASGSASATVKR